MIYSSSFEMKRQHTYRGSSFHVGWIRHMLVYDNSLSPWSCHMWHNSNYILIASYYKLCVLNRSNAQCPERLLGIVGGHPSVSKTDRLHVDIFWGFFSKHTNIIYIYIKKKLSWLVISWSLESKLVISQTQLIHPWLQAVGSPCSMLMLPLKVQEN